MAEESRKILIVEDEPETATLFGLMLEFHGYRVVKAHGIRTAIAAVERERPDAILLDVMMPGMSGLELCRYVRRDPSLAHLPVIIISARVRAEDVEEGMRAGASAYLTKPVTQEDLVGTVQKWLA